MSQPPDDGRSPMARGMMWASQISTLGIEMALPILGGYYLDRRWNSSPVCILIGVVLGFGIGLYLIIKITQRKP